MNNINWDTSAPLVIQPHINFAKPPKEVLRINADGSIVVSEDAAPTAKLVLACLQGNLQNMLAVNQNNALEAAAKVCENLERKGSWITKSEAADAIRNLKESK